MKSFFPLKIIRKFNNTNILSGLVARNLITTSHSITFSRQSLANCCLTLVEAKISNFAFDCCSTIYADALGKDGMYLSFVSKKTGESTEITRLRKRLQKLFNYIYKPSFKHTAVKDEECAFQFG